MVSSHHRTESIVQSLAQVSRAWNQEKETAPPKYPLRIMLLSALLEVTIERAEAAVKPDRKDATVEAGLILDREEEPFWPFLRWNPDKREEEILSGEEMRPLEHSRLIRKLNHIRDTIHPENVLRCHGHHQITEQMQAETYRLVLEVETAAGSVANGWDDLHWRIDWPQAHEQHDAAEFLMHFLAKAEPHAFSGQWQSRMMQLDRMHIQDRGSLLAPLNLDRLGPDLQACLDLWEGQSHVHAMIDFNHALVLQIHRFEQRADGAHKVATRVQVRPGQTVAMPTFAGDDSTSTTVVNCRVSFVVYHLGPTMLAGHYKTALCVPGGTLGFGGGWKFVICNDATAPYLATARDYSDIECNCYLVGLYRTSAV
eukprot:s1533_g10.t2